MKYLPLILKHLRHNWVRTASTALAISVCILLLCTLETFLEAIRQGLKSANASRLVTRHNISLTFPMPISYKAKIAGVPGVRNVATANWFGGIYQDRKNFFPNFAIDAEEYFAMYPEYVFPEDQRSSFMKDLKGCIVGRETVNRFHWDIGTVFQLESFIPSYRKNEPFEFVVRGIYDPDEVKYPGTPTTMMFFHFKYLYEGTEHRAGVGTYITEVTNPDQAVLVSKAIDDLFENSDNPTKTETEAAFRASFASLGGDIAFVLRSIALGVIFTILLVTANTMSLAIRERRTEIGIFKTLGFSDTQVLSIILGESLILGVLGGVLGITFGLGLIRALPKLPLLRLILPFPEFSLSPVVAGEGFVLALLVGLAAGLIPAILSYRARVTQLLRQV